MKREYILDMEYEWSVGNDPRANGEEENQMVHKFIVSCIFCRRRYGIPQFPRWSSSSIIGPFSSVFLWSLMEPIKKWNTHGNLLVGLLEMGHVVALYLGPSSTRGTHVFFHLSLGLYEWSSITTGKSIHLPEVRLYIWFGQHAEKRKGHTSPAGWDSGGGFRCF